MLAEETLPAALVDLDALDENLGLLVDALGDRPVTLRVASKSLRVPWLLRHLLDAEDRLQGVMCYSPHEAELLADQGFHDLLVAYPVARRPDADAFARLAGCGVRAIAMVDDAGQLPVLERAAFDAGVTIPVCLDVDVSWRPFGGLAHLGVRRSPIRDAEAALAVAERVVGEAHLRLVGVMAYEAQVAGLPDHSPGQPWMTPAIRLLKARSVKLAAERRHEVVRALQDAGHAVELVNGGGTGSVHSTSVDPTITEVTAGSGFLCPHLFDGYDGLPLLPAAFFALPVVRRSDPGFVTCAGGGYVASGAAGPDRLPVVHWPEGVKPLDLEGFGEVQTPVTVPEGVTLVLGDPVVCRHAKAGELAERFDHYLVVRGGHVVARAPTYRGLGATFL